MFKLQRFENECVYVCMYVCMYVYIYIYYIYYILLYYIIIYYIIYIIYIYMQLDIALWHTKLCFHVQIEHSTRMSHCC